MHNILKWERAWCIQGYENKQKLSDPNLVFERGEWKHEITEEDMDKNMQNIKDHNK